MAAAPPARAGPALAVGRRTVSYPVALAVKRPFRKQRAAAIVEVALADPSYKGMAGVEAQFGKDWWHVA